MSRGRGTLLQRTSRGSGKHGPVQGHMPHRGRGMIPSSIFRMLINFRQAVYQKNLTARAPNARSISEGKFRCTHEARSAVRALSQTRHTARGSHMRRHKPSADTAHSFIDRPACQWQLRHAEFAATQHGRWSGDNDEHPSKADVGPLDSEETWISLQLVTSTGVACVAVSDQRVRLSGHLGSFLRPLSGSTRDSKRVAQASGDDYGCLPLLRPAACRLRRKAFTGSPT